jgi:hypothetical protein
MKKCLPFLAVKEMQIKTTLRFHLTLLELLPLRTPPTSNAGVYAGEKGTHTHCGRNVS